MDVQAQLTIPSLFFSPTMYILLDAPFSYSSASSSPPSSPNSAAINSSPPSSPGTHLCALEDRLDFDLGEPDVRVHEDDVHSSPAHPYSASTRGVKRPPSYEMLCEPEGSSPKRRTKESRRNRRLEVGLDDEETSPTPMWGTRGRNGSHRPEVPSTFITRPDGSLRLHDQDQDSESNEGGYGRDAYLHDSLDSGVNNLARVARMEEEALWEDTIASAIDEVSCNIDLR